MLADTTHKVAAVLDAVDHEPTAGADVPSVVGVRCILSTRPIIVRLGTTIKKSLTFRDLQVRLSSKLSRNKSSKKLKSRD